MSEPTSEPEVFLSTSVAVAAGLAGGFILGRRTKRRAVAGAVFGGVGLLVGTQWFQNRGPVTAAILGSVYVAAMGLSHPLAKRVGAIPAVLLASAAASAAAYMMHDKYVTVGLDPAEQPVDAA